MSLLFDEDYQTLNELGISYVEDEGQRFLVFKSYPLPENLYEQIHCDVLVIIPTNYNQDGNDMFWTNPRLIRKDGRPIPNSENYRGGDSRQFDGREFCRWSRHWRNPASRWRPGIDDITTILRRIEWALRKPDADK